MKTYSVSFITLGCAKNQVDTSHMARRVVAAGLTTIDDPEQADVVVVNTCSFIRPAVEESIETVFEVLNLPNFQDGQARLVVAGCMPARYGEDLEDELTEASAFVPCLNEKYIVEAICESLQISSEDLPHNAYAISNPQQACFNEAKTHSELLTQPDAGPYSAFVKISEGCNRFCSFCMIPYIRGRYHSFELEDIDAQIKAEIAHGAREIVLIAQDTGRWGDDFETPSSLAVLLDTLATRHPDTWFRVLYMEPQGVNDELLRTIAAHDNICSYLDVPIQHANAEVLKNMNRSGSGEEFLQMYKRMRELVPDIVIRTTLIAGFPGETEEQFQELCDFLEQAELDYVGVFPYSAEEGTAAYKMEEFLDEQEKMERAQILRDIADSISVGHVAARVGQELDILVLGIEEDGQLYGRAQCQAPEVDGVTYISLEDRHIQPGDIVHAPISDSLLYEMEV